MHLFRFRQGKVEGLAVEDSGRYFGLAENEAGFPGNLGALLGGGPEAIAKAGDALSNSVIAEI